MSLWPGGLLRKVNCGDCSAAAMLRHRPSLNGICEFGIIFFACVRLEKQPSAPGEMAEWLKAHAWKACLGETLTRVRIPLSPPSFQRVRLRRRRRDAVLVLAAK